MTNAEKYLKDGLENIESLIQDFFHFIGCVEDSNRYNTIYQFFLNEVNPQLTQDERVILRNLRYEKGAYEYTKIGRTDLDSEGNCDLILIDSDDESVWWGEYGHLFQFIKNGEEYLIKELLENDREN